MKSRQILTILTLGFSAVLSERILFLYPNASPSHKNIAQPIMLGLAERGHSVTVVSSFKTEAHKNIRDIMPFNNFEYFPGLNALELRRQGIWGIVFLDYDPIIGFCEKVYQHQPFLQLLNEKFDIVIMDIFANECLLGVVHKLGAPLIYVSPLPVPNHVSDIVGNRLPPSFVPHFNAPFGHNMNLLERAANTFLTTIFPLGMRRPYPTHEAIYRKHLGEDVPGIDAILSNTSLILTNQHFSFNFPRPMLPDVVEIGAIHCRPGRPLPKEIDEFVSNAKDGFILFSLGSIVRPHEMPDETRKAFVNVFSRLKQRVLWKWPHPMSDAPPNVKLLKWIPQQDVLAHSNIKLFITHGGLLSTQESIYHGVPMVDIPVFGDQDLNAKLAKEAGIALTVELLDMTEDALENAIHKVLNETSFTTKVKEMSNYLRDQQQTPKDRALFWVEYVMRHKGAPHMRSAARELNFFQYYCLDVVAVLFGVVSAFILLIFFLVKRMIQFIAKLVGKNPVSKKKMQ